MFCIWTVTEYCRHGYKVAHFFGRDNQSDSSSLSQTSYEPGRPLFQGMESEIPEQVDNMDTSGGITLVASRPLPGAGELIPLFIVSVEYNQNAHFVCLSLYTHNWSDVFDWMNIAVSAHVGESSNRQTF